jgi:hypothetical protein
MLPFPVTRGHPRLWIRPRDLAGLRRQSLAIGLPWRKQLLRTLDAERKDPVAWRQQQSPRFNPPHFALALGMAWRLTGNERYADAAEKYWAALDEYPDSHGYDGWGEVAEAGAVMYDWLHDWWRRRGLLRHAAQLVLFAGRRAWDDLRGRYILEDWHNYSLGLQAGVLAAALAVGDDHPDLEDGTLLRTMQQFHFTGLRVEGPFFQDFHPVEPFTRCLTAALRDNGGRGACCMQEATGSYMAVDSWEVVKMACLWQSAAPVAAGDALRNGLVWPEVQKAGEAILQIFRPDGRTTYLGDAYPGGLFSRMADGLVHLHARRPHPDFAALLRSTDPTTFGPLPIHPLLCARPDILPVPAELGRRPRIEQLPPSVLLDGVAILRSGWDEDATLLTFRCGRHGGWHNHLDHGSFTLFRGGPLAIDSGGGHYHVPHRPHYATRTLAHNCILVRNNSEPYWLGRFGQPVANDGGQRIVTVSYSPPHGRTGEPHTPLSTERQARLKDEFNMGSMLAFESCPAFDYVAGDATPAYTWPWSGIGDNPSRRVEEAVRQIVFLKPDWIVIFDRVEATRKEFAKTWLLHTMEAPLYRSGGHWQTPEPGRRRLPAEGPFQFRSGRGRMTVWPLLPERRVVRAVGGKGYEWWVDRMPNGHGANLPPEHGHGEVGSWRLEVSPRSPSRRDCFLTVIHAGLAKDRTPRDEARFDVQQDRIGVNLSISFASGDPLAVVQFALAGAVTADIHFAGRHARYAAPVPGRVALGSES